ncbi:MAG: Gfo/Idh/MocA family oxidoreductase [Pseudomonadota bacterium]
MTAIAVVGAGLIGARHVDLVAKAAKLAAVVDPAPEARALARAHGVPWRTDLSECLKLDAPDGVIIATPNHLHVPGTMLAVEAGVPVLVEKPIADAADDAARLVGVAEAKGVPLLVGHHRRHNALVRMAREVIDAGRLGRVVAVQGQFWLYKPEEYFDVAWRSRMGAGPVFINLIHDIDLMRHLCGEVVEVQARFSNKTRGFEVEDTAALILQFANGALGTISVSDTVAAPWSWEFTAGENPAYPHVPGGAYRIGGTEASLSVPDLTLWAHPGKRSWWEPIEGTRLDVEEVDPLEQQLANFVAVIRGQAKPVVSGQEGLRTLRLLEAITRAAKTGKSQSPVAD